MKTYFFNIVVVVSCLIIGTGCGSQKQQQGDRGFVTSGSREADQRAEQRMAKSEQLADAGDAQAEPAAERQKSLYERLGGEEGMKLIVDDFVNRALADPRVNWERKGVERGGFRLTRNKSVEWNASPENVEQLKKHIVQFLSLSTGGPSFYDGKEMRQAHADLRITNAEFDASIGDLKATLDKLKIGEQEQRELLAIVESTRPQVVQER